MRLKLFQILIIEAATLCDLKCPTCLRQNDPARRYWVEGTNKPLDKKLPAEIVYDIVDQAAALRYRGEVHFCGYNEPLLDPRYFDFARYARKKGMKPGLFTNGTQLNRRNPGTPELARQIEETIYHLAIDRYDQHRHMPGQKLPPPEKRRARTKYLRSLFTRKIAWGGPHLTTHYSPRGDLQSLIEKYKDNPCYICCRMFIDFEGTMRMCCHDIGCNFELGNIHDSTLEELWFGPRHVEMVKTLHRPGGRRNYAYCRICPLRGGAPGKYPNI